MNFKFYSVIHNVELNSEKNRGKKLTLGKFKGRLTNNSAEIEKVLEHSSIAKRIGYHSSREFLREKSTYIKIFDKLDTKFNDENMDEMGNNFAFILLRTIEKYTDYMWAYKDNSAYIRDGFLFIYDDKNNLTHTYKASLSTINTLANVSDEIKTWADSEIEYVNQLVQEDTLNLFNYENDFEANLKDADSDLFIKGTIDERLDRAFAFSTMARSQAQAALKIVSYITALECLFTTSTGELSHRVAERVSILLKEDLAERKQLYSLVKTAYNVRSAIVHGNYTKKKRGELAEICNELDNILRDILMKHYNFFKSRSESDLENEFQNLIFQ